METFAERLKAVRVEKKLKQREAAEQAGIPYRTYQDYELGNILPTLPKLIALSKLFNVSMDYLGGLTDNPTINR